MKRSLAIGLGLVLAACGGGEHQDLKEELKALSADMRGTVKPLPVVKPYAAVPYTAFDQADPFGPAKIELATRGAGRASGGLKPDLNRPKEPLEAFPLETLRMVGVLERSKQMYALVRADANLYRIRVGAYLGQNFGLVTGITDTQIQLRELVQDAEGEWTERKSALQLQEAEAK